MLKQGAITGIEADAAALLRGDHNAAFGGGRVLAEAGNRVDTSHNPSSGLGRKFARLDRYRQALRHLGDDLGAIAKAAIIDADASGIPPTINGVGVHFLPEASGAEQSGGGKVALVLACRKLAVFYGLTGSDRA